MNETDEVLNLVDLLDRLAEVPEPEAISMLPQTWGWAVVGFVLLTALSLYGWRRLQHYRRNAYRRDAIAALINIGEDPRQIAEVLRRTALCAYPRAEVAALCGKEWMDFLDRKISATVFTTEQWQILAIAPYKECEPVTGLNAIARHWVANHEVKTSS